MKTFDEFLMERRKIAKTNICYLDKDGNVVSEEKATKCIITEYDSEGKVINEILREKVVKEKKGDER